MKRIIVLTLLLVAAVVPVLAQARLDAVSPKDPRTMALGGAFVALADGYAAFYGNPAAFAGEDKELTIASFNPWAYVSPTTENLALLQAALSDGEYAIEALNSLITTNGLGIGASAGLGWVGKGLGIGLVATFDSYVYGRNALGAMGPLDAQLEAVFGVGTHLSLFGLNFSVGGDIRPYLRMTGQVSSEQMVGILTGELDPAGAVMALPVDVGFGLAADLGARLELGRLLSVGLAIRDIGTRQTLSSSTVGEVLDGLASGSLPSGGADSEYAFLPNITIGAALRPLPEDLSRTIDLLILFEIQDPVRVIADQQSFWQLLHLGVEAEFFGGTLALRAGVNEGYLSLGAGLDLFVAEASIAVFAEEMGLYPGQRPRVGMSAELAIRF